MIIFKKIATCQGDDYAAGFLLDYKYFKNYYKMIDDADPKAISQSTTTE